MLNFFVTIVLIVISRGLTDSSEKSEVTGEIVITAENIKEFFPALVLRKLEKGYFLPHTILPDQKGLQPYSLYDCRPLTYLCPVADITPQKSIQNTGLFNPRDYCLVEKHFETKTGPFLCESEVKPLIVDLQQKGSDYWPQKVYNFVYQDCRSSNIIKKIAHKLNFWSKDAIAFAKEPKYFTIYFIRYDMENKETISTSHYIESPGLLKNKNVDVERSLFFDMNTEGYGIFEGFEKIKNVYDQENNYGMAPQKLVPPDDLEMGLLRKATFHYINVKPMQKELFQIWDTFNRRLKNLVIRDDMRFTHILTGTFGTLQEGENNIYLDEEKTVGIPKIWCKLVKRRHYAVAFFIHNFIDENQPIEDDDKYCTEDKCNLSKWSEMDDKMVELVNKYAYCCEISEEIAKLFYLPFEFHHGFGIFKDLGKSELTFSLKSDET